MLDVKVGLVGLTRKTSSSSVKLMIQLLVYSFGEKSRMQSLSIVD